MSVAAFWIVGWRRHHFRSVQWLSPVQRFVTPWTAARQASLSITNSQSLLKLMTIESVMPSNHLILCHPLLLPPSIFPSIRVFSNESVLHIRWPNYWSFSFSISPSNAYSGLVYFRIDWFDLLADWSNCQHPLDHWKSKRVPETHLLLLYWLHQSLWLCGSQQNVENSERDGRTRPPYLPPEKSVYRSRSNS